MFIIVMLTMGSISIVFATDNNGGKDNIAQFSLDKLNAMDREKAEKIIEKYKKDRDEKIEAEINELMKKSYLKFKENIEKKESGEISILANPSYYTLTLGVDKYLYNPNESNSGGEHSGIGLDGYESNDDIDSNTLEALTYAGSGLGSTAKAWAILSFNIKTNGSASDKDVAKLVTKKDIIGYFFQEHAGIFPSDGSSKSKWSVIIYDWNYDDGAPITVDSKEFLANRLLGTTNVSEINASTSSINYTFKGNSYYTIVFKLECESDSQGLAHTEAVFTDYANKPHYAHLDYIKIDF